VSALRAVGLRARLAIALAGMAVASVVLATVLSNQGLDTRLNAFAHDRLRAAARHSAELAADTYVRDRGWSRAGVSELDHLAHMNGYRLVVLDGNSRRLGHGSLPRTDRASAAVRVSGREVGSVIVSPLSRSVLTGEDRDLHARLNHLHLLAAGLAAALAILASLMLARQLARPLRRLTEAARRMEGGDLRARSSPGGGAEMDQLTHALNRLAETLEREDAIRRGVAADVAHELRTPLTGIVSRIEAAQDGVLPDEGKNLEAMHAEALRLAKLVDDLGRLAEAEKPGLLVEKRPLDIAELAKERAAPYEEFFAAKGIDFRRQLEPAAAYGDAARIEQIVDNLLANALRYTDSGGRVVIRTRPAGAEAVLEVEDNGIGIPPEDLPHIFDRFWRGEKSRSRATGGAGIGLTVVNELTTAQEGRIAVDSRPGAGSRFTVILPAEQGS